MPRAKVSGSRTKAKAKTKRKAAVYEEEPSITKPKRIVFGNAYPWVGLGVRVFIPYGSIIFSLGPWLLEVNLSGK